MEALAKQMVQDEIVHGPTIGEELKGDEKAVIEELKGDEKVVNEAELKGITSDDMGEEVGQEDIQSLTARKDDLSELFAKCMGQMNDSRQRQQQMDAKLDAFMMSLGPHGPQALAASSTSEAGLTYRPSVELHP